MSTKLATADPLGVGVIAPSLNAVGTPNVRSGVIDAMPCSVTTCEPGDPAVPVVIRPELFGPSETTTAGSVASGAVDAGLMRIWSQVVPLNA